MSRQTFSRIPWIPWITCRRAAVLDCSVKSAEQTSTLILQTFNQALATLYHKRLITADVALQRSSNVDELKELMDRGSGLNTGNGSQNPSSGNHPSPYTQSRPVGTRPTITK